MSIRHIVALSLVACAGLAPRTVSAELLAGFHRFDTVTEVGVVKYKGADEGVFAAESTISYNTGSTNTGGSTDNWYGPDGRNVYNDTSTGIVGGQITNQTPFDPTEFSALNPDGTMGGAYVFETGLPGDERLDSSYAAGAPIPSNMAGGGDSTGDGRIRSLNGTDVEIQNTTRDIYRADSFVFDAFIGDTSDSGAVVNIDDFVLIYSGADGSTFSANVSVSAGHAGYGSQSGEGLNDPLGNPLLVNNEIDYGVGTNYFDYVVNLNGIIMKPGDTISIGLNATAIAGTARGDNFAFFGTAVPEPSSVLAIGALLGLGGLNRRRKLNLKLAAESA